MRLLLTAALLPVLLLMWYIFRHDSVEKEPAGLLLRLALLGALSCLPAALLESLLSYFLIRIPTGTGWQILLHAFFVVALSEEGIKLLFLKKATWRSPHFNYRFDGIVYAVFISLGFAALENVLYVFSYGMDVAFSRALLAVPGHMTFSVFMGLHYANAKQHALCGDTFSLRRSLRKALWIPVLLHGFYDYCLMSGSIVLAGAFLVFVLLLDTAAFLTVRRQSAQDSPLEERFFF